MGAPWSTPARPPPIGIAPALIAARRLPPAVGARKVSGMPLTWLITGCSRGLGRALAEAVAASGDRLVATARDPDTLADLFNRYPDRVLAVALDVTDRERPVAAVEAAVAGFGRLDVVVNTARHVHVASIEDVAEADFRAQVETNLWGAINVTRAALPVMRAQRSGQIIQASSSEGRADTPGLGPFQTAAWGVEGFSAVLAKEVAPLGIHVTVLGPGDLAAGDRDETARAIMRLATLHDPPLHLGRAAEDERRELTLSPDR